MSPGGILPGPSQRSDYEVVRQTGSHIRMTTRSQPEHHLTIPDHASLRVGTLAGVIADVAAHHGLTRDEVLEHVFGRG